MNQDESVETHVVTVTRALSMDLYRDKLSEVVEENLEKDVERMIGKVKEKLAAYKKTSLGNVSFQVTQLANCPTLLIT